MNFLAYFANRQFLARIITVMVLLTGIMSLMQLNLQEYPDVAMDTAEIETIYPGATAQDIELNITNPIEKELRSVDGIAYFSSESSEGRSFIEVEYLPGEDAAVILRDIQQAVDRVGNLPKDIDSPPVVTQQKTSSLDVYHFGVSLSESNTDPASLQHYAYQLEKRINNLGGVGSIKLSGFNEREFWVEVDPEKARRYQVAFDDISTAIEQHNLSQSGGFVESWSQEQKIVTMTKVESTDDVSNIVIKALDSGQVVRVSDVATVIDTFARATQDPVMSGKPAVIFSITNSGSADVIATIDSIKALLDKESERIGDQFIFQTSLDLGKDMGEKFSIVATNGAIGLVLVLLILSMILQRRVAFWVSVSIPFCVFGVMIVLPIMGLNLDSITLAALLLVIGIIVDDSVIIAESIFQEKEAGKKGVDAAVSGTLKVIKPLMASLVTTALVFIPMMFIPGTMGKAVAVIPITVIAALVFSFIECTLTLPAHLASAKESSSKAQKKDRFEWIANHYLSLLNLTLNYKKSVIALALVGFAISGFLVSSLKVDIFPTEAGKYIEVYTEVKAGTPLSKVREAHQSIEQAIESLPETELVSYELVYSSPVSQGTINLTNFDQRSRSAEQIIASLNEELAQLSGDMFIKFSIDAGGPPPGEPVEVRVLGGTESERNQTVELVMAWLEDYQGVTSINHSEALKDPQLNIVPQYHWLAKYNLTVSDLSNALRVGFDGNSVTSTWLGDQEVDIRVVLDEQFRDLEKLKTTKIYTADGQQVPLSRLAMVEQIEIPRLIKHYNGEREVTVSAALSDESISPVALADELVTELTGQYPSSVTINVGGEAESTNETMSGFMVVFPAAMVAIYFVLAVMFNSLLQPLLIMAVIPFAIMASLMALVVHMQPMSLFGLIGVLGMTGVVVNNSLVLINRINELRIEGLNAIDAVTQAAVSRLRPIVMTSLTTVAGLLPLAYGLGGTDVFMGPMSLTLGYGLLFSLPVVLLVIPAMYALFFSKGSVSRTEDSLHVENTLNAKES
ncbi:putative Acriflavin resistance protein [Vibrio crassostreae]|uniref:efflux RND transporter permease subunit n=1 Tax=Vibrio crassostreae TaxID=246167 RepID=UPI000F472CB9|nr:efflux RND transporter permease subunit [Vibrio crassostreae]ROO63852.1 multidrug efflux pump subunit AcrB [Vibrio crassostreae]CAK1855171.1 putative Acriflavin resistance protein [Vibrio crassostreae]CAK1991962.1 putative Acriflavin resistance protein [Vibrio crassostreae]CAK2724789.1 putative Acriflavin resistance protein [Vibrio crassostreae]CAK3316447.1 putative Acriflavin resistance protein [Vibrio crassostreae]